MRDMDEESERSPEVEVRRPDARSAVPKSQASQLAHSLFEARPVRPRDLRGSKVISCHGNMFDEMFVCRYLVCARTYARETPRDIA